MKIQYSIVGIILGASLVMLAILASDHSNALAQMDSELMPPREATPQGANMTGGGNMTGGNITEESIPTANTTGFPGFPPPIG